MAPPKTPGAPRGTVHGASSQNILVFTLRATPLPSPILEFILENLATLRQLHLNQTSERDNEQFAGDNDELDGVDLHGDIVRKHNINRDQFWDALHNICKEVGGEWEGVVDKIWAFGPQKAGGCLLIDDRSSNHIASYVSFFFPTSMLAIIFAQVEAPFRQGEI